MKKMTWRKWTARALALMLAGSMVLGGSALCGKTAYAAEIGSPIIGSGEEKPTSGSLTIKKNGPTENTPLAGAEFSIYRVMSLTPGDTPGKYAEYKIEEAYKTALSSVKPDELGNYSTAELEALIDKLVAVNTEATAKGVTAEGTGAYTFANLALGYYLVVETGAPEGHMAGSPFLIAVPSTNNYNTSGAGTAWVYDVTAEPKNVKVGLDKELAGEEDGAEQDGTVAVGDYVKYTITTTIPQYPDEYFEGENTVDFTILDTMSDGLTIQNNTTEHPVTVMVDGTEETNKVVAGADTYTMTAAEVTGDNADLSIAFVKDYIKTNRGKNVIVTYYAQVNAKAVMGKPGNPNTAKLEYSHKPGTANNKTTTPDSENPTVKVYTFGIQVAKFKTENDTKTGLEDAKFQLYKGETLEDAVLVETTADDNTMTSGDDGILMFPRLDEGTYFLKETQSPKGFTLLANPIKVEITATKDPTDDTKLTGEFTLKVDGTDVAATEGEFVTQLSVDKGIATVAVENHKGFSLPSTGGMGVTLFLIVGAAGIIGLSIAMTRKPKNRNK